MHLSAPACSQGGVRERDDGQEPNGQSDEGDAAVGTFAVDLHRIARLEPIDGPTVPLVHDALEHVHLLGACVLETSGTSHSLLRGGDEEALQALVLATQGPEQLESMSFFGPFPNMFGSVPDDFYALVGCIALVATLVEDRTLMVM